VRVLLLIHSIRSTTWGHEAWPQVTPILRRARAGDAPADRAGRLVELISAGIEHLPIKALSRLKKLSNQILVEAGFPPILIGPCFVERRQCSGELVRANCCASDEEHEHLRELSVESPHLRLQALHPVDETG
jgi:hypothetical protein